MNAIHCLVSFSYLDGHCHLWACHFCTWAVIFICGWCGSASWTTHDAFINSTESFYFFRNPVYKFKVKSEIIEWIIVSCYSSKDLGLENMYLICTPFYYYFYISLGSLLFIYDRPLLDQSIPGRSDGRVEQSKSGVSALRAAVTHGNRCLRLLNEPRVIPDLKEL